MLPELLSHPRHTPPPGKYIQRRLTHPHPIRARIRPHRLHTHRPRPHRLQRMHHMHRRERSGRAVRCSFARWARCTALSSKARNPSSSTQSLTMKYTPDSVELRSVRCRLAGSAARSPSASSHARSNSSPEAALGEHVVVCGLGMHLALAPTDRHEKPVSMHLPKRYLVRGRVPVTTVESYSSDRSTCGSRPPSRIACAVSGAWCRLLSIRRYPPGRSHRAAEPATRRWIATPSGPPSRA